MSDLDKRLNQIIDIITSDDFLSGTGLGNEIPFWAFDYDAEDELHVREHVKFLLDQVPKKRPDLTIQHINLLELVVDILKERNLFEKSIQMQEKKGNDAVKRALSARLDPERVAEALISKIDGQPCSMIFITGVGSAYPLIRTHNLLNNLHAHTGETPLVVFYPGKYDGQTLRLFGELRDDAYYRAFRLVS
jgi:bacteriophage exclusion system BrxB-like protein